MTNFIIAGKLSEARDWVHKNKKAPFEWKYLSNTRQLRSQSEVHGIFIGTWRERQDMGEIFYFLLPISNHNPGVARAYLEYQIHEKLKK